MYKDVCMNVPSICSVSFKESHKLAGFYLTPRKSTTNVSSIVDIRSMESKYVTYEYNLCKNNLQNLSGTTLHTFLSLRFWFQSFAVTFQKVLIPSQVLSIIHLISQHHRQNSVSIEFYFMFLYIFKSSMLVSKDISDDALFYT